MKKLLLFAAIISQTGVFAQAVPNGAFENWNQTSYNEPSTWTTGNLRDVQRSGIPSVTKVTGFSGFGLRIETTITGPEISESYIINTDNPCNDPPQWTGGVPYSQQPTAITGYYRYSLPVNDTALMIVIFRKNGAHIGDNYIKIRGTGTQNTWASFSFPVTCNGTPDSVIIAAASSNKINNVGIQNGSFLELDNLAFAGATQQIANGTFESWAPMTNDKLTSWNAWGSGISRSTVSHTGIYAIRLETTSESCQGAVSSGITTGTLTNNGPKGGIPYTGLVDTLCGYYKYTPAGTDTAIINVNLTKNNSNIFGNGKWLTAAANYSYFEIPLNPGMAPDTMRIDIASSKWMINQSNIGSVLFFDNLFLKSSPVGIKSNADLVGKLNVYPNPAKEFVNFRIRTKVFENALINIYDYSGKLVLESGFVKGTDESQVNLCALIAGMYYYEVVVDGNTARGKLIRE